MKGSVQFSTIQYNSVQFSTIQYNSVQFSTIQYNSVQFSTIVGVGKVSNFHRIRPQVIVLSPGDHTAVSRAFQKQALQ
jgi:hypothetical protein